MATNFSTLLCRSLFLNLVRIKPKLDQFRSQAADEQGTLSNLEAIGHRDSWNAIPCHYIAGGQVKLTLLIKLKNQYLYGIRPNNSKYFLGWFLNMTFYDRTPKVEIISQWNRPKYWLESYTDDTFKNGYLFWG